jgi:hypothetical protein
MTNQLRTSSEHMAPIVRQGVDRRQPKSAIGKVTKLTAY